MGVFPPVFRFLHVIDKCRAIDVILHHGDVGEIYNIGCDNEISVIELCRKFVTILCDETVSQEDVLGKWVEFVPDRPYNDCRYAVVTKKLEKLGWTPQIDFLSGLTETVNWYKENQNLFLTWGISKEADQLPQNHIAGVTGG